MASNAMSDDDLRERVRALLKVAHPDRVDQFTFRGAQYDHGLAWVHFPEGYGGLGLNPKMQAVVNDELRKHSKTAYDDLAVNPIGIGMGAPTLLTYGSDELKSKLMRRIFTGEDIWCQLFSEPGAGSDVAGLASRAVRDGDDWVVNGQKVWTTLAHISKWGMLVARTNPDLPKHEGMSYFLLDMESPGVDVVPLYQITGEAEFNEVFLNDVRIPRSHMLGNEGQGWQVAITTLMNERTALGGGSSQKAGGPIMCCSDCGATHTWCGVGIDRGGHSRLYHPTVRRIGAVAPHLATRARRAALGQPRAGRVGGQARASRAVQEDLGMWARRAGIGLFGVRTRVRSPPPGDGRSPGSHDDGEVPVPPLAGELDRRRHVGDHAQHPRRARARPAGGTARRQERPVERRAQELDSTRTQTTDGHRWSHQRIPESTSTPTSEWKTRRTFSGSLRGDL
jgi:hypothetical protein